MPSIDKSLLSIICWRKYISNAKLEKCRISFLDNISQAFKILYLYIVFINAIKIFEEKKVRTLWDSETEEWYFSIVDVIAVLTDSPNPSNYWKVLKYRLKKEGNESVTNGNQLKIFSSDGKYYKTDVATAKTVGEKIMLSD